MSRRWKTITGLERYKVSDDGIVWSSISNTQKRGFPDKKGYLRVQMYDYGKAVTCKMHRLVAQAFIPNPDNKPQVNHKDGDKQNNHYTNLEWMTNRENATHAIDNGLFYHKKEIRAIAPQLKAAILNGYWITELADKYNVTTTTINRHIRSVEPDYNYKEVVEGIQRKKFYYFDESRNKFRTELPKRYGAARKQFENEEEMKNYIKGVLHEDRMV